AEALETTRHVSIVAFDKTGTLTEGRPVLAERRARHGDDEELLAMAAALQAGSEHPLAKAVLDAYGTGQRLLAASGVHAVAGRGLRGEVAGRQLLLGSSAMMAAAGVPMDSLAERAESLGASGPPLSGLRARA